MDEDCSFDDLVASLYDSSLRSSAWEELFDFEGPREYMDHTFLSGIWDEIQAEIVDPMKALKNLYNGVYTNEYIKRRRLEEAPTLMLSLMGIDTPADVAGNPSELEAWWSKSGRNKYKRLDQKTLFVLDATIASGNDADMNEVLISVLGVFVRSDIFLIQERAVMEVGRRLGRDAVLRD